MYNLKRLQRKMGGGLIGSMSIKYLKEMYIN